MKEQKLAVVLGLGVAGILAASLVGIMLSFGWHWH